MTIPKHIIDRAWSRVMAHGRIGCDSLCGECQGESVQACQWLRLVLAIESNHIDIDPERWPISAPMRKTFARALTDIPAFTEIFVRACKSRGMPCQADRTGTLLHYRNEHDVLKGVRIANLTSAERSVRHPMRRALFSVMTLPVAPNRDCTLVILEKAR